MPKELILSIIKNYNFHHIRNFIQSLKNCSYKGDVFFYVASSTKKMTLRALQANGIKFQLFDEKFPYIEGIDIEESSPLACPMHLFNYRHLMYWDYLQKNKNTYEKVMLSDVRDVFFQRSPFLDFRAPSLYVAIEDKNKTIGSSKVNVDWLTSGFGLGVLDELKEKNISCAGTIIGDIDSIRNYLRKMIDHLENIPDPINCIDQAIHNYMIYKNQLSNVKPILNETGSIQTMSYMKSYRLNEQNEVINDKSEVVNVLHQYDRHPSLKRILEKKIYDSTLDMYLSKVFYKVLG